MLRSSIFDLRSSIFDLRSSNFELRSSIFDLRSSIFDLLRRREDGKKNGLNIMICLTLMYVKLLYSCPSVAALGRPLEESLLKRKEDNDQGTKFEKEIAPLRIFNF